MSDDVVSDYASRNNPLRVEVHALDMAGQQGGLVFQTSASNLHLKDAVAIDCTQHARWNVHKNVTVMLVRIVVKPPSATFHVNEYFLTLHT